MNPIVKMFQGNQSSNNSNSYTNNLQQFIQDLQSGKLDPKQQVLSYLQQMTADQKQAILQILPKVTELGKVMGASEKNIEAFVSELQNKLR